MHTKISYLSTGRQVFFQRADNVAQETSYSVPELTIRVKTIGFKEGSFKFQAATVTRVVMLVVICNLPSSHH